LFVLFVCFLCCFCFLFVCLFLQNKICSFIKQDICTFDHLFLGTGHLTCRGGLCLFVSFRIFFSDNTRVRIFIFFCREKREFFFQNLTVGYMTKTLNQSIIFFLHQNQNIFFSNIGNQNIFFRKKKHTPLKLNGPSLMRPC
jgi:hypothetical protein